MQNQFLPSETTQETTPYVTPEPLDTAETTAAARTFTELLAQAQHKVHRRKVKFWGVYILLVMAILSPAVWELLHHGSQNLSTTRVLLSTHLSAILFGFGMMFVASFMPGHADTEALAKMGGTKAIPILLDSLTANMSFSHRRTVLRALTVLLPQMQASDAALLTPLHRYTLNVMLGQSRLPTLLAGAEYAFALALLKAYEQVGDAKAISIVERLAKSRHRNERQRRIQTAAEDCLPLLQAHVGGLDVAHSLLRASMLATNAPDTLLRAATSETNAGNDELLRAATANDAPPAT